MIDTEPLRLAAEALVGAGEWQPGFSGSGHDNGVNIVSFGGADVVHVAHVPSKIKRQYIIAAQPQTILALIAELSALKHDNARYVQIARDAERYRWLLANHAISLQAIGIAPIGKYVSPPLIRLDAIQAAIDAAIKAKE